MLVYTISSIAIPLFVSFFLGDIVFWLHQASCARAYSCSCVFAIYCF